MVFIILLLWSVAGHSFSFELLHVNNSYMLVLFCISAFICVITCIIYARGFPWLQAGNMYGCSFCLPMRMCSWDGFIQEMRGPIRGIRGVSVEEGGCQERTL